MIEERHILNKPSVNIICVNFKINSINLFSNSNVWYLNIWLITIVGKEINQPFCDIISRRKTLCKIIRSCVSKNYASGIIMSINRTLVIERRFNYTL